MVQVGILLEALQIIATLAVIVIPIATYSDWNPLRRRSQAALSNLQERDDDPHDLVDEMYEGFEDSVDDELVEELRQDYQESLAETDEGEEDEEERITVREHLYEEYGDKYRRRDIEQIAEHAEKVLRDVDKDQLDYIARKGIEDVKLGYITRGDPGFNILLDAIAQHRTIKKREVETIGVMEGPSILLKSDVAPEVPKPNVPQLMRHNATVFIDYEYDHLAHREIVIFHPSSPTMTLSLTELEMWVSEVLNRKHHTATIVVTVIWTTISLLTLFY